ncbi:MAG: PqqD family protein [Ignavibacteriales bacterium]
MDKFNIYKKNPYVVCTELDACAVLLDLDTKYFYTLNETGLRIWQMMEKFYNPVEISKILANEYVVTTKRAETRAFRLIEELEKEGLIIPIKEVIRLSENRKKQEFVEPQLIKSEEPLDKVTMTLYD